MAELDPVLLGAALLAAVALGAVVYVFLEPYLSGQRKVEKRLATIAEGGEAAEGGDESAAEAAE